MIYGEENTVPVPNLDLLTFLFGKAFFETTYNICKPVPNELANSCLH